MKKFYRIFILFLLFLVLTSCTKQQERAPLTGACGTNATWSLPENGTLTITGTGETVQIIKGEAAPWEKYKNSITSVVISDGITALGSYLFFDLPSLCSVTLADSVTTIGASCFQGCDKLCDISFSNNLTTIETGAFSYCSALESISFPKALKSLGDSAFSYCVNLSEINTSGNISHVGKDAMIGTAWLGNHPVGPVYLDAVLIKYIADDASSLSLSIPYGITSISESACENVTALTYLSVPETLLSIGNRAFYHTSLQAVRLNEGIIEIGNDAFSACEDLCYIRFDGSPETIGTLSAKDSLIVIAPSSSSAEKWAAKFKFIPSESVDEAMLDELLTFASLPEVDGMALEDGVYTFILSKVHRDRSVVLSGFLTEPVDFTYKMYQSKNNILINGTEYAQVQMNDVVVFCPPESIAHVESLYAFLPYAYIPARNKPSLIYLNNGCDYLCTKTAKVSLHCASGAYLYPRVLYMGDDFYGNAIYDALDLTQLMMAEGYEATAIREMDDFFFSGYGLYIWGLENKNEVQTQIVVKNNAVTAVVIPNV